MPENSKRKIGKPPDPRRALWAARLGLSASVVRHHLSEAKLAQLDKCEDDAARRLLMGRSERELMAMTAQEREQRAVEKVAITLPRNVWKHVLVALHNADVQWRKHNLPHLLEMSAQAKQTIQDGTGEAL